MAPDLRPTLWDRSSSAGPIELLSLPDHRHPAAAPHRDLAAAWRWLPCCASWRLAAAGAAAARPADRASPDRLLVPLGRRPGAADERRGAGGVLRAVEQRRARQLRPGVLAQPRRRRRRALEPQPRGRRGGWRSSPRAGGWRCCWASRRAARAFPRCGGLRRLEVWLWDPPALAGQGRRRPGLRQAILVLVRQTSFDARSLRPWAPGALDELTYAPRAHADLESALAYAAGSPCFEAGQIDRLRELLGEAVVVRRACAAGCPGRRRRMAGWTAWRRRRPTAPPRPGPTPGWRSHFPGGFNDQTIVNGRIVIRAGRLHQLAPGQLFDRVTITGDVYRGDHLADSFEIVHHVAGAQAGPTVALDFYRRLRPADYTLDLRAVDGRGQALLALRRELRVPEAAAPAPPPAGRARGYSHLTRPDVIELTTFPGVELLPASAQGGGEMRLHASTTGGPIDAVEFRLDGRADRGRRRSALHRLDRQRQRPAAGRGDRPGPGGPSRWPTPIALARARDAGVLGPLRRARRGPRAGHRQRAARRGRSSGSSVSTAADRRRPSTAPPWRCPLPRAVRPRGSTTWRCAPRSPAATIAEDVLFLGPGAETVDVRLAELYLSVVDAQGRPVAGLGPADFRLRDGRGELPLDSVAELANLPLNVSLLMDVSSSMGREVRVVAESAQRFFETILEPGDLAALAAFNHDLHHLAPFTGDAERPAPRLGGAARRRLDAAARRHHPRPVPVLGAGQPAGADRALRRRRRRQRLSVRAGPGRGRARRRGRLPRLPRRRRRDDPRQPASGSPRPPAAARSRCARRRSSTACCDRSPTSCAPSTCWCSAPAAERGTWPSASSRSSSSGRASRPGTCMATTASSRDGLARGRDGARQGEKMRQRTRNAADRSARPALALAVAAAIVAGLLAPGAGAPSPAATRGGARARRGRHPPAAAGAGPAGRQDAGRDPALRPGRAQRGLPGRRRGRRAAPGAPLGGHRRARRAAARAAHPGRGPRRRRSPAGRRRDRRPPRHVGRSAVSLRSIEPSPGRPRGARQAVAAAPGGAGSAGGLCQRRARPRLLRGGARGRPAGERRARGRRAPADASTPSSPIRGPSCASSPVWSTAAASRTSPWSRRRASRRRSTSAWSSCRWW